MRYQSVIPGFFVARPNRFVAQVETADGMQTVHVKNTGRCRELLVPGARVYLAEGDNPARKTRFDLIAVEKGTRLINMDAQAPNQVFGEWAEAGGFLPDVTAVRREVRYGDSRLDFCLETSRGPHYVEVKGVTLEAEGRARFPDAPTERGVKHIQELQRAVETAYPLPCSSWCRWRAWRASRPTMTRTRLLGTLCGRPLERAYRSWPMTAP